MPIKKESLVADETEAILQTIPGPFFVLDRELKYRFANQAYLDLAQLKSAPLGKLFSETHPNGRYSPIALLIAQAMDASSKVQAEDYCPELRRWFKFDVTSFGGGITVFVKDITDEKKRTLDSAEQESVGRRTLAGLAVGVARLRLDGRCLGINARARQILGLADESEFPHGFRGLFSREEQAEDLLGYASLINGSMDRLVAERQVLRADGQQTWIHLQVTIARDAEGRPAFYIAAFDDITERKEAEESLQFALEAASMGDWDYDALHDETRRSLRFHQIFGYANPLDRWGYGDFVRHLHPEDRGKFDAEFHLSLSEGRDFSTECRILWPDRSIRWISLKGRVYLNNQGRAFRMAGLVTDITAEKMVHQELQNAKLSAEDANREKTYFLANMSHEIRTPLGAILGFTEALKEPGINTLERTKYLQIISRNGRALSQLIDDILDLSKVEAGHLRIERASLSIGDLLEEVVTALRLKAEAKQIQLSLSFDQSVPRRQLGDAIRIRQIALNIIGNAIKFTSVGEVSVTVEKAGDHLAIRVRDTGPGLTPEQRQRLFQPFTQADSSTSRKFGGTGLGLALSRRLARAMDGDVGIRLFGGGSRLDLLIELPIVAAPEVSVELVKSVAAPSPIVAEQISLTGLKILLAEDSPDNQILLKRLLAKKGGSLETADDGVSAVEKALHAKYDLVLMDMQMPRLDGYEATRELRRHGYDGPIIALTAHAMRHDRDKCIEAGCSDYVSKPVNPEQLYRALGHATLKLHS